MDRIENYTVGRLLEEIAAKTPTPGGGAVASAVGAVAAALAGMVVAYSLGKKNLAEHQPALEAAAEALRRARQIFLELAEEDAAGYAQLNEVLKLPAQDPRRVREMPLALVRALSPPRAAVAAAADMLRLIESLVPITSRPLRSDLAIAGVLAESAARSAWWNVEANLTLIPEAAERAQVREEMLRLLAEAGDRRAGVERACRFEEA